MIIGLRNRVRTAIAVAAVLLLAGPAIAQSITTNEAVTRLFTAEEIEAAWFTDAFLDEVPLPALERLADTFTADFGAFVRVEGEGRELSTVFEQARFPTQAALNEDDQFTLLFFGPPILAGGNLQTYVDRIASLPGESSVLVMTDGEVVAAHRPDLPLGVGSAFKLVVLLALQQEIEAGNLSWDRVLPLTDIARSMPSGILQDWPTGTPLTVATLANLMISISDNTATDLLIDFLGRETLEALSPRNVPFLRTSDMFRLKVPGNVEWRAAYLAGDEAARRAILEDIATLPVPNGIMATPVLEIEWFISAEELCGLLAETKDLPPLLINTGLARGSDWASIAYKGGSESGVLNFSTWLTDEDGHEHCVVATWNDTLPVNDNDLAVPTIGIIGQLAQ